MKRRIPLLPPAPPQPPPPDPPWFLKDPRLARVAVDGGMTWQSIPQYPAARWEVDVSWTHLFETINLLNTYGNLELDPDFQRGHVWTDAQRVAWLEYVLQGGEMGRNITFVTNDWQSGGESGFLAILDGKQRLETVVRFMRGDVRIFPDAVKPTGYAFNEIGGVFRSTNYTLKFRVVETPDRAGALNLYLSFNGGGTPHSQAELDRVRALLDAERRGRVPEALLEDEYAQPREVSR